MRTHRAATATMTVGLALGILAGACLPSAGEGERGVQCWTDQAIDISACNVDLIWCFDDADPGDPEDFQTCNDNAERCANDAIYEAEQCDLRPGCIARRAACQRACQGPESPSDCGSQCTLEFDRCAPWYDATCERDCLEKALECAAQSAAAFETVRCENERLECVLECY